MLIGHVMGSMAMMAGYAGTYCDLGEVVCAACAAAALASLGWRACMWFLIWVGVLAPRCTFVNHHPHHVVALRHESLGGGLATLQIVGAASTGDYRGHIMRPDCIT